MKVNRKTVITAMIILLFAGSSFIAYLQFMNGGTKEMVVFETSMGKIEIELYRDKAPITVANFVRYVNEGFYNGTVFHRVIKNFVIQGGGFNSQGIEKTTHEPIILESNNGLMNKVGTIAMARTNELNSATSQFYINLVDNDALNYRSGYPGYAVFGKVVTGLDIVKAIGSVPTADRGVYEDWPVQDIVITKAYVLK